jgi:hypothetical protein
LAGGLPELVACPCIGTLESISLISANETIITERSMLKGIFGILEQGRDKYSETLRNISRK